MITVDIMPGIEVEEKCMAKLGCPIFICFNSHFLSLPELASEGL